MKLGRNDPCPCGSGKKYKHCCLDKRNIEFPVQSEETHTLFENSPLPEDVMLQSMGFDTREEMQTAMKEYEQYCRTAEKSNTAIPSFMEYLGRPNMGSDFVAQIRRETADQVFSSKEELESAISHIAERENTRGLDDFLGLSSSQMHSILSHRSLPENELFSLNTQLTSAEVEQTIAVKYAVGLLTFVQQEGGTLALTPKGNLKRDHTTAVMASLLDLDRDKYRIRSEDDIPHLTQIKYLLYFAGYIDLLKTRLHLTAKGTDWLGKKDPVVLYLDLLTACADDYEWLSYGSYPDDFSIIQDSLPFALYMLKKGRNQSRKVSEYAKEFIRAFPAAAGRDEGDYRSILLEAAFLMMFVYGFCFFFGLIQLESGSLDPQTADSGLTVTELFDRLFLWKL
jgi:hypothetical protein